MDESRQIVLISDPERLFQAGELFPKSDVAYANGSIPPEAEGRADAVAISTDAEWCDATCRLLAQSCTRVRYCVCDLSTCTTNAEAIAALKAAGIHEFKASASQEITGDVTPPTEPVKPAGAEQDDQRERESAAPEPNESASPQAPDPTQNAPESTQEDAPPDWHRDMPPEGAEAAVAPFKRSRKRPRLASVDGNLARAPDPDDEPLPAKLSEDALAEHFVATHGDRWRYVPEWGVWLEWRGDGWHRDTLNAVTHVCRQITRECLEWPDARTLLPGGKQKISSKRMAWNVRDMAAVDPKITILAAQLDADPWLLGVPGGCVDLKTGKLMEANPEDYVTRRTLVAPEKGPHPIFDRVLERAESGHDGMRGYLYRALGYCLTGQTNEEVFFHLTGQGGSGKGTLTRALQAIWGDYADTIAMDALIETKQARHTQEIAKLEGMRLVFANESEEGRRFNESLIKWLTGGDRVTAHRMRMDDHTFTPTFKLLLSANSTPHLKSVSDGAMKRRIHLIEYAAPIAEDDKDSSLKERMIAEYPAILYTLIQGCVEWQDCRGLGKPESVSASVDAYLEEEDNFAEFLAECILPERGAKTRSGEVYRVYLSWCQRNGEKYPLAMKRFVQTMRGRGYESTRSAAGKLMAGLKLIVSPADDSRPPWQQD